MVVIPFRKVFPNFGKTLECNSRKMAWYLDFVPGKKAVNYQVKSRYGVVTVGDILQPEIAIYCKFVVDQKDGIPDRKKTTQYFGIDAGASYPANRIMEIVEIMLAKDSIITLIK